VVLGVFSGACAIARLSPFHEPEPITGILILTGIFALCVVLAWRWMKHDDAISIADDLILLGYGGERRRTGVDCALADRIAVIESPRARHRLAADLRWRLRLAAGTTRPSPGYMRTAVFPPLGSVGRRVFLEEQLRIARAADRIDESRVDPRALVMLWRIVTTPPEPYLDPAGRRRQIPRLSSCGWRCAELAAWPTARGYKSSGDRDSNRPTEVVVVSFDRSAEPLVVQLPVLMRKQGISTNRLAAKRRSPGSCPYTPGRYSARSEQR
jgi:hypothetical protein